jgi:electron transfer flavoprotein beta subunit
VLDQYHIGIGLLLRKQWSARALPQIFIEELECEPVDDLVCETGIHQLGIGSLEEGPVRKMFVLRPPEMSINPFDEIALEEALRIKERGEAEEVVIATIGPADCQQQLRAGLAMGADRALHVQADGVIEPLVAARALLKLIEREQPFLVILGKQAIDNDNSQTGPMLAALWDRPQATFASKLELLDGKARVTREVDAGLETLEVDLPALITTDLRLHEPRYVKLPDIMKAKKKPLETLSADSLGVVAKQRCKLVKFEPPAQRQKGIRVKDAGELVAALRQKGLI